MKYEYMRFFISKGRCGMDEVRQWYYAARTEEAAKNLVKHGYEVVQVSDRSMARDEVLRRVPVNKTVGVAGSVTIRDIGVLPELVKRGHSIFDHWAPGVSREKSLEIRRSQMTSDVFLTSVNAITMNGELVNIDGSGNRVNSTNFGPEKVILVAGYNKIVEDVQEAIKRIKNVSAPLSARRLNVDVPCAKLGKCVDCNSPNRMCRILTIHERKPFWADILIILVGEELGY
jgi:hypothetical protein